MIGWLSEDEPVPSEAESTAEPTDVEEGGVCVSGATEAMPPGDVPLCTSVYSARKCRRSSARSYADEYRSLARLASALWQMRSSSFGSFSSY